MEQRHEVDMAMLLINRSLEKMELLLGDVAGASAK